MKINIINAKENKLLKRKEIVGVIEHQGEATPSKAAVQQYLAKKKKLKPKHVEIKKIFSPSGSINSKLLAYIWKEKEVPILEEKKKKEKEEKGEGEKKSKK